MAKSNLPDVSALAGAAASSPFDLRAEQSKQELLLERNNRGLDALARALEAQGNAGFLQRMAAQQQDFSAYRARVAAVIPAAQRAYLATPAGRQSYQEAGRQQDVADTAGANLQRRQAELDARRMAGPDYQAAAFARAAAGLADGLSRARAANVAAGAANAYQQTPQGQAVAGAAALERAAAAGAESLLRARSASVAARAVDAHQQSPQGRAEAGAAALERAAASSAEALNRFRASALGAAARLSHLRTPEGQKQYAEQGRQQDLANAADAQSRQRQARMESARQWTPEYQQSTAERAAAASMESLNQLRARVAGQQAEVARARTPEGRAEARERQTLERRAGQLDAAHGRGGGLEFQAQMMNLARALPLGLGRFANAAAAARPMIGTAMNPEMSAATRAAAGLGAVAVGAGAVVGAFGQMQQAAFNFAAAVSPSAASTYESSMQLFSAHVGHTFVPAMDAASQAMQKAAAGWDRIAATRLAGSNVGDITSRSAAAPFQLMSLAINGLTGGSADEAHQLWKELKTGQIDDMTRDFVLPGVHARSFGAGQIGQFGVGLQQASLESGGRQTQLQVLQEILKELQGHKQILTTTEQHAATNRYGYGY